MSSIEDLERKAKKYREEALQAKMRGDIQTGIQKLRLAKQYEKLITQKEIRELEEN